MASARAKGRSVAMRWTLRVALLVVAALAVVAVVRTMHDLNLGAIGEALGRLRWWEIVVLLAVLVLRQLLSALPLTIYIPGVSLWRAVISDLTALTTAALASAPGKIAARVAIFAAWGIPAASALAGSVLNTLTMFVVRFGIPLIGFVLAAVSGTYRSIQLLDVLSLCFSGALIAVMVMVASAEATAVRIGRWAGRSARRFRAGVDPDRWADSLGRFQQAVAGELPRRFARGVLAVTLIPVSELALLILAVRFVGLTPAAAPAPAIAAIFFLAYPLTMFPLHGAGLLDVAILLSLFGTGGGAAVDAATAGLLIWRALTVVGPYALAAIVVAIWRGTARRQRSRRPPTRPSGSSGT